MQRAKSEAATCCWCGPICTLVWRGNAPDDPRRGRGDHTRDIERPYPGISSSSLERHILSRTQIILLVLLISLAVAFAISRLARSRFSKDTFAGYDAGRQPSGAEH